METSAKQTGKTRVKKSPLTKLEENSVQNAVTGCKEWTGDVFPYDGYGRVCVDNCNRRAHRVAWALANPGEELTSQDYILHLCNNRLCVEPTHLLKGNHKLNMQHMVASGRSGRGGAKKGQKKRSLETRIGIVKMRLLGFTALEVGNHYGIKRKIVQTYCSVRELKELAIAELNSIGANI